MKVSVRLFAVAKQIVGAETLELEMDPPVTIGAVREHMHQTHPEFASLGGRMMFSVDAEFAADDQEITAGSEVACIPPVSGG